MNHFIGPFTVLDQIGPVTYRLANMGQKADVVHSDRLKPYRSSSGHSICMQYDDKEDDKNQDTASKKAKLRKMIQRDVPKPEELVEKLQAFLQSVEMEKKSAPKIVKQAPPLQPCKRIAKHRRWRTSHEYLVHDED